MIGSATFACDHPSVCHIGSFSSFFARMHHLVCHVSTTIPQKGCRVPHLFPYRLQSGKRPVVKSYERCCKRTIRRKKELQCALTRPWVARQVLLAQVCAPAWYRNA